MTAPYATVGAKLVERGYSAIPIECGHVTDIKKNGCNFMMAFGIA